MTRLPRRVRVKYEQRRGRHDNGLKRGQVVSVLAERQTTTRQLLVKAGGIARWRNAEDFEDVR